MSESIQKAASWLATTPDQQKPHPILPHLIAEFGLTTAEAVAAIREANHIRARPE